MGVKRVPTVDDAVKEFKSVMLRASLDSYLYVDRYMLSKSVKDFTVIIIPDQELWVKLLDDEEIKPKLQALDLNDSDQSTKVPLFRFADEIESEGWLEPDLEQFFKGTVIKVKVPNFEYDLSITKDSLPIKLRKAEQNRVAYRVFLKPNITLAIKKRFVVKEMEQYGFTMLRLFQVI